MSGLVSFVCLTIVAVLAAADVFYIVRREQESKGFTTSAVDLLKVVGVSMIGLWAFARLPVKAITGYTEPVHLILHLGLACLSLAMAYRHVEQHRRTTRRRKEASHA